MKTRSRTPISLQPKQEVSKSKKTKQTLNGKKQKQLKESKEPKDLKDPKEPKQSKKPQESKQEEKKEAQIIVLDEKVQQEKKQKKPSQPKKYLNKNYDQVSRIARSKYQKIYLLQAQRDDDGVWDFVVQGVSGSNYRVKIHNTGLKCSCVDFRMKQKPCKHIYFIVTQVAQNLEILDYFNNSLKISKAAFTILDQQLAKRLQSRMSKPQQKSKQEIDLKDDTDCTICFTEMNKDSETLEGCGTCKKYFHFECLSAWKKHNPTCPLCRSNFIVVGNANDPLGKLKTIQINSQQPQ